MQPIPAAYAIDKVLKRMERYVWKRTVLLLALVALVACSDRVVERFSSLSQASAVGAAARGIVPSGLPPCAESIIAMHDTDTGQVWGTFSCERSVLGQWLATQTAAGVPKSPQNPRVEWWPKEPVKHVYRSSDGKFLFAVDKEIARVWFWRPGE